MSSFASLIGLIASAGFVVAAGSFGYPAMIGFGALLAAAGAGAVALWFTERAPISRGAETELVASLGAGDIR